MQRSNAKKGFFSGAALGVTFTAIYAIVVMLVGNVAPTNDVIRVLAQILVLPATPGVLLAGSAALPIFGEPTNVAGLVGLFVLAAIFNALIYGLLAWFFGWISDQRRHQAPTPLRPQSVR